MTVFDLNKIMKGSPPPIEYQVTLDNWRKYPFNSWSFVNVRNLIPTSPIYNDPEKEIILQKLGELKILEEILLLRDLIKMNPINMYKIL